MMKDSLQKPLEAATRALSKQRNVSVRFRDNAPPNDINTSNVITLSVPDGRMTKEKFRSLRGEADLAALSLRYHSEKVHASLRPGSAKAAQMFDALERTRIEILGSENWQGVAANLTKRMEDYCIRQGYEHLPERADPPAADILALLLRERTLGIKPPDSAKRLVELWRSWLEMAGGAILDSLPLHLNDQQQYGMLINSLIKKLEAAAKEEGKEDAKLKQDADSAEEEISDEEGEEDDSEGAPSPGSLTSEGGGESDITGGHTQSDAPPDETLPPQNDAPAQQNNQIPNTPNFSELLNTATYHPFTTRFDEVVKAESLVNTEEMSRLRMLLDDKLSNLHSITSKLASRLGRVLMARQAHAWEHELEDGIIDGKRLTRVIIDPNYSYFYKREKETDFRDTVVTLLLDNSGSMRGRPITVAALCADILARTLERCGVKVEILGFTTRDWKGGQSRKLWTEQGRKATPGRLNDLRHIIYKSADMRWQKARKNIGLMLKDGILKENIDGEAILWAYQRLVARPEQRRILMVISDGAPVDDSTLSVNSGSYLDQHLRHVIEAIEDHSNVELLAIGIGHDVTRYYKRAVTISDAMQLGDVMARELVKLFKE
jgi:cobaltochelatase CobT